MSEPRHIPKPAPLLAKETAERIRAEAAEMRERQTSARRELLGSLSREQLDRLNIHDVDAAAECFCACHPSPADSTVHGGGACSCQKSAEERAADRETIFEELQRLGQELAQAEEAERAALQDVARTLGVNLRQSGGAAPYQLLGDVDGINFYLRERHDEWSLSIPDDEAGDDGDPVGFANGIYILAEGHADTLYDPADPADPAAPVRRAAELVREHILRRSCTHPNAGRWCPDCGARIHIS